MPILFMETCTIKRETKEISRVSNKALSAQVIGNPLGLRCTDSQGKLKMVGSKNCAKMFMMIVWAMFLLCSDLVHAKSRGPISDTEIRQKKLDCYADIESGLWGQQCTSSIIAKENCALRCLSPICYELIYESDPLEEGEKDFTRNSEYKYCMHRDSLGESLDGIKGSFDN